MAIRGLVLRRGSARIRVVRFGGPKVRKARGNVADVHEAGDVFMYRDSSIAPLLDLRRRLKAVMDVLDSMIRSEVSLPRSLNSQSSGSVFLGLVLFKPITRDDLELVLTGRIGDFRRVAGELHRRLCEFVHRVVVHRRDEAFRGWRNWLREDLKFTLTSGCGLTWCFLPLFSSASLILLRGVLGFWLTLQRLMRNSEGLGFPIFVVLGKGKPAWRNLLWRFTAGCPCFLRFLSLL